MQEPLTDVERKVYQYLLDFLAENTYQPSIREIAKKFRIRSTKTVSDLLHALARKGYIERDRSRSRGVRLVGYASTGGTQPVPLYGRIHAGEPSLLPENREGYVAVDRRFVPSEDAFLFRVQGDSMTGRGILDGDYVLVAPSTPANDGDIVAARFGAETTIKTLRRRGGHLVLESANAADRDLEVGPDDDFSIIGVVAAVMRSILAPVQAPEHRLPAPGTISYSPA